VPSISQQPFGNQGVQGMDWYPHATLFVKKNIFKNIQGADDKLGQFLDQDIEATANHRNVLRLFLESCPSLVSLNVNKPSIFTKICRQNTKLVQ
jgi:hypothetical protein